MAVRKEIRVGVVGYGGAFNMGKCHLDSILKNEGFVAACLCDPDKARREVGEKDYPGVETYASVTEMLKKGRVGLVVVITPHNTHAPIVIQCLKAGAHVVCEKPLAITAKEVSDMLKAATASRVMLSTFHNRRWDGDYLTLKRLVAENWIGKIFRVECGFSGYHEQGTWWRSNKKISGGAIYDWGAHFTDWYLGILPGKIDYVTGFQVKNPAWTKYTNEDHSECTTVFKDGCVATLTMSNLSAAPRPKWRILGVNGSIVAEGEQFVLKTAVKGKVFEARVNYDKSNWDGYYANVADHLVRGKPLAVTAKSAARVIGVLHAANVSAAQGGKPVKPLFA